MQTLLEKDALRGVRWVAGADEAGRGCLAGPVTAAAVLFDMQLLSEFPEELRQLNDSKQLSKRKRQALVQPILESATRSVVIHRSAQDIDLHGIQACNLGALADALRAVSADLPAEQVVRLSDGFELEQLELAHEGLVKGDSLSAAIAAASILAKQSRDAIMQEMHVRWPEYGFDRSAGYPTARHRHALMEHGPCGCHRLSYAPVKASL